MPGLTFADVGERARKFMAENNVHLVEERFINDNNRLFVEGCRRLGYHAKQFPVNINLHFSQVLQESRIMVPARTTGAVSSTWVEYCLARTAELG